MVSSALCFVLLFFLPTDFEYPLLAAMLALLGISMGTFGSPNRAAVMNSLPPGDRGVGGAMNQTFQNSAPVLSIGILFTLMIVGLAASLPSAMASGLEAHGVSAATASHVAHLAPASILFAAFLGYDPIQHLVGAHALAMLTPQNRSLLIGHSFFSNLISAPFRPGLHEAFAFAIVACLVAAGASLMRGGRYYGVEDSPPLIPRAPSRAGRHPTSLPEKQPTA